MNSGGVEGRTVAIEYRWSEGRPESVAEIAADFVRSKKDVIVTAGPAVAVVKKATSSIPIVFALENDPVGNGLVESLARPGGNVTGLSVLLVETYGKRLELLREVVPTLRRLLIIFNADYPAAVRESGDVQTAAQALGIEVVPVEIRQANDIATGLAVHSTRGDALYVVGDALVSANRTRIITLALSARLPTIFSHRGYVQAGGLMSYGPNYIDQFRRAAELVDKILHGRKAADIPVEQPSTFELVVNLTTAKALNLTIPEPFLVFATEVIE